MTPVSDQTTIHSGPDKGLALQATHIRHQGAVLSRTRVALMVAAVTLAGTALRLHMLAAPSLWIDEASSVEFALMQWRPFLRLLWSQQGNMTLYYLLLRAWMHLGDSEFVVRGLSVLFGVITIPAIYLLGKRLFDRATGITAAVLLSLHSFHIQWSQEARAYSLLVLLLVLSAHALVSALESNQERRRWIMFTVVAALCVYAHVFAVLVLSAFALAVVFPRPFQVERRNLLLTAIVFACLAAPMAAFVLLHNHGQIDWIPQPRMADVLAFLEVLTGQGGALLVVTYLALCGLAIWYSSQTTEPDRESWAVRLLALWLVLPPLLTLVASVIKPVFLARYLLMCVPALILLAARGVTRLYSLPALKHWAAAAAMLMIVVLSGWGVSRYFGSVIADTTDWRSAVNYILERQQPGDGAVFFIPNTYPYLYYSHRAERQHRVTEAPEILYPPVPQQPLSHEEVMRVTEGRHRVWMVLHFTSDYPRQTAIVESTLGERFQLQEERVFTENDPVTVALYSRAEGAR